MIVGSELVRTDGHVRPDLVLRLMGPQTQRVMECVNCVVAIVFAAGLVLVWVGDRGYGDAAGRAQLQRAEFSDVGL